MHALLLIPAALLLLCATALHAQGAAAPAAQAAPLQWGPAPAAFPPGAKMAVVSGDPSKPGPFTIQLSMPDGYRIPPHFHPTDEGVEVKEGMFLFGTGDTFQAPKLKHLMVGDKGSLPANMHHFAQAKGATVVAVTAVGPFAMTYVNPADDPRTPPSKP